MDPTELLLHPVRLRIVRALSGGPARSASELCERLPDVPRTSIYRQLGLLVDGGMLEIGDERRVRGAVERFYRLRGDRPTIAPEAGDTMTADDHRRGFAASMAVLIAEFNAYLDRPGAAPFADSVSYRQGTLWLSAEELDAMLAGLHGIVAPLAANQPGPGRRPYVVSPILFPGEEPAPGDGE
ncbi:helix-turn-helix domain-containing protein [Nocardia sp. NEAU-G5]|uniref:Helix-turn-helix domain-containing protein n=1 Tax=Nocardia albiluteola TaxID=2842303 RepID=A0ABS6B593_9NOCA|nr:helix-turn-helix domain-containing protein [Nocardia albiluteola]MBU3062684.1 helix-turn-helix domain-containing protein [Nocardia albiluteola]MBU3065482.1 helix-turn-helix domain-containing protein [Nocardia albiluteola]